MSPGGPAPTGQGPIDLAHELRTPLHTILTAADLVLSGDAGAISAEAAGLLGEIVRAARRLETLSRALLAAGIAGDAAGGVAPPPGS